MTLGSAGTTIQSRSRQPAIQMDAADARRKVLHFIGSTFQQILSEIEQRPYGKPQISLQRVNSVDGSHDIEQKDLSWEVTSRNVTYGWPGKNKEEAWRFACVGRILAEIHGAITAGIIITKRDIFYRDPVLFRCQETVDRYIDDISYTCKVTRKDLNVAASPKGLYVGLYVADDRPHTILDNMDLSAVSLQHVRWILVVEKEATFKLLVESHQHQSSAAGPGILLTGKGYPDLATRRFLRDLVNEAHISVPVYGLFDADPDGIAISLCYQAGSKAMIQERECCVPEMKHLDIKLCDIDTNGLLPLTIHDRSKARAMLLSLGTRHCHFAIEACRQLQRMLILNSKAEIQALEIGSSLTNWLQRKLVQGSV